MKVPKSYIGKRVKVVWKDPHESERQDYVTALRGQAALARWEEEGVIDDITDGVVRIRHSVAYNPGVISPSEAMFTWVVEDLITEIKVFVEEVSGGTDPERPQA